MNVTPARRLGPRAAASVAAAGLVVLATPAVASATTITTSPTPATATASLGTVTPLLDCYTRNADGSYTALLGYTSTYSATRTITSGSSANTFNPTRYNGAQPSSFTTGTHHAAFSVKVLAADIPGGVTWTLDGHVLDYAAEASKSGICSPGTSLPAEGNGTGWTIALVAAGAVGAGALVQTRRRTARAAVPGEARDA